RTSPGRTTKVHRAISNAPRPGSMNPWRYLGKARPGPAAGATNRRATTTKPGSSWITADHRAGIGATLWSGAWIEPTFQSPSAGGRHLENNPPLTESARASAPGPDGAAQGTATRTSIAGN